MSGTGRFVRHVSVNLLVFVALVVAVGTPVGAVLTDLFEDDYPPLVAGFLTVLLGLAYFGWLIALPLIVYLALVFRARRLVAVLLSLLAVGGPLLLTVPEELPIVLGFGVLYALSLDLPRGRAPWWRDRRALVAAAAVWVASLVAVGVHQRGSAGVKTDVTVTVEGERFRLACEYDRAGRLIGTVQRPGRPHPGGEEACELLEEAERWLREGNGYLQRGCPRDARRGLVEGKVSGRRFRETIVVAECEDDAFLGFDRDVVVPAPTG